MAAPTTKAKGDGNDPPYLLSAIIDKVGTRNILKETEKTRHT